MGLKLFLAVFAESDAAKLSNDNVLAKFSELVLNQSARMPMYYLYSIFIA